MNTLYHKLIKAPSMQKPWFYNYIASRPFYTTICRLRFNHNYSPHHLLKKIGMQMMHTVLPCF
ncbi:hypothetical protein O3M35_005657 [Rhynocoris fuscipes]|uniref:Uncharacterized protein n=1 Tax=Rhynocoris fuscipes TaxID=488301 RepID=A0AAW1DLA9_9HEMI